jgi:hypothetical protein
MKKLVIIFSLLIVILSITYAYIYYNNFSYNANLRHKNWDKKSAIIFDLTSLRIALKSHLKERGSYPEIKTKQDFITFLKEIQLCPDINECTIFKYWFMWKFESKGTDYILYVSYFDATDQLHIIKMTSNYIYQNVMTLNISNKIEYEKYNYRLIYDEHNKWADRRALFEK